jgi:uncharacterized protein YjbI with pentapeptide repeats
MPTSPVPTFGMPTSCITLMRANLTGASFRHANLTGAHLSKAQFAWTVLANLDLSKSLGLETAINHAPSTIGIDTFFNSKGKIPEAFLRGAGVPDIFIQYAASLTGAAFEFYSCFISYSSKDADFVHRLHADLESFETTVS